MVTSPPSSPRNDNNNRKSNSNSNFQNYCTISVTRHISDHTTAGLTGVHIKTHFSIEFYIFTDKYKKINYVMYYYYLSIIIIIIIMYTINIIIYYLFLVIIIEYK